MIEVLSKLDGTPILFNDKEINNYIDELNKMVGASLSRVYVNSIPTNAITPLASKHVVTLEFAKDTESLVCYWNILEATDEILKNQAADLKAYSEAVGVL